MSGVSARFGIPEPKLFEACKFMEVPLPPPSHYEREADVEDLPPPLPPHNGQNEFQVDAGDNEDLVEQYMQLQLSERLLQTWSEKEFIQAFNAVQLAN